MADRQRAQRMAKRIRTLVADAIEYRIKDPRLQYVTVTDCRITGDLHDATVYYTVRGRTVDAEPDYDAAARALDKATGSLRSTVGAQLKVRFTPTLTFELDTIPDSSTRMEELLARARQRDAELAALAEGKTFAGDPNPYRTDDNETD